MVNKRRQPRQSRSQITVGAILDSVSQVIHKCGPSALTTNRIAEIAGVSIGTLYQYFSDKQDIYTALHERQFKRMSQNVRRAFELTNGGTLDDMLVTLMDTVIQERLKDPEMHMFLLTTVPRKGEKMVKTHPLSVAFYESISSHKDELRTGCNLDRFVFTLSHMIGSLANAVVLFRPENIAVEEARDDAIQAIRAFVKTQK